jgi:hypothetical protein
MFIPIPILIILIVIKVWSDWQEFRKDLHK